MKSLEISKNTISSLEIAELSGMTHDNVLKDIRKMEPGWIEACQKIYGKTTDENFKSINFNVIEYKDAKVEMRSMYELTKSQSLFIATNFNDEARALLLLRWEELEHLNKVALDSSQLFTLHYGGAYTSNRRLSKLTGVPLDVINSVLSEYLKDYVRFEEVGSKKMFNEGVMVPDVKYNGYDLSATESQIMDHIGFRYIAPVRNNKKSFIMNNFVCYSGFDSSRESNGSGFRECYMTSEGLKDFLNFYSKKMIKSGLREFSDLINNEIILVEHQIVKSILNLEIPKEHWITPNGVHLDEDGNFNREQHCHYFFSRKCFYFRNFSYWYQVYLNYCKDNDIKIPLSEKKVEVIYNKYKVRFSRRQ
ncbi:Rha family transcriptional regulator [Sphingobacterium spiritivorum]|uniref:Rha family transcriptional regulator n=1 Tax=Sphingobacterium spiritivorum TaxID=258 RepID=UPI00191AA004|nr:Rha family transcriptional regulator [Sphingobacterium spiritivorum]QQT26844.1 Rha family transcriptional regulator [Sphingobacterium spiritivorum]